MLRHRRPTALLLTIALVCTAAVLAAACGGSGGGDKLVVYSGREQELVEPLYAQFTKDTGIELDVRWGESPELAATIREVGDATPADVFYAQDAGSIGVLDSQLMPPIKPSLRKRWYSPAGSNVPPMCGITQARAARPATRSLGPPA